MVVLGISFIDAVEWRDEIRVAGAANERHAENEMLGRLRHEVSPLPFEEAPNVAANVCRVR